MTFLNVHNLRIKGKFVVQCYSKVFETVHYFNCLIMNDNRVFPEGGLTIRSFVLQTLRFRWLSSHHWAKCVTEV